MDFAAIKTQVENMAVLKERLEAFKLKAQKDSQSLSKAETLIMDKEVECLELRKRIEVFENGTLCLDFENCVYGIFNVVKKGFGVREAVKEVKELRVRNGVSQKEINSLVQKVNDMESQVFP